MIKDEWRSLIGNKLMILVIIAVVAIPLIYAGLFLKSMWDPYGNVDKLPVAVVNEDKPVEYNGSILNIGSDMVTSLRDSGSMAFNFVDSMTAEKGLENGTYYMVITIPENFSANATTLMGDTPQKMELDYATNPGTNYIASKLSESALTKIKDAVAAQVTETYAKIVFEQITAVGEGMQQAADGAGAVRDGLETAKNGNQLITDNLDKLASSTLTFQDGTDTLVRGLEEYTNGVATVNEGAVSLKDGSTQLVAGAETLADGAGRLHEGANSLTNGAGTLASGMQTLKDGAGALIEGINAIDSGAAQLKSGAEQLAGGVVQVDNGVDGISAGIGSAKDGAAQISAGSAGLVQGTLAVSNGLAQVQQKVSSNKARLKSALGMFSSAIGGSADGGSSISQSVAAIASDIDLIIAKQSVSGQIDMSDADVQAAWMDIIRNEQILNLIINGNGTAEQPGLAASVNVLNNTLFGYQKADGTMAAGAMDELEAGIAQLYAGMGSADSEDAATIVGGAKALNAGADSLNTGLAALQSGASQLKAGTSQLSEGAGVLSSGAVQLAAGTNELAQKSQTLVDGVKQLSDGAQSVYAGAAELSDGAGTLAAGARSLYDGTVTLDNGAASLAAGTGQLAANSASLNTGAAQLAAGAAQLHDGSAQLYDGSVELADGIAQLYDGSSTLADSLADGAAQTADASVADATISMFAAPVSDVESQITTVENNGHAMAPYMMSVGLWVGALAFCLMYPLTTYKGELKSGFSWWAGKASVLYIVALLQGLLLIVLLHLLAGFDPAQMGKTVLFACLTSVTFTSIMYFFNITLGKVGSFLMLVFMVLQLAGSAGTYPVEISPDFVSAIHWVVPFTYTVNAFRSTISGGMGIGQEVCVMAILFAVFTVLTILRFHYMTKKRLAGEPTLYDRLEEKGLA